VSRLANGRFGPVFLAQQPGEPLVIVRTFAIPLTDTQANRLIAALNTLCGRPLDHPRIARPIECGIAGGGPYLVHSYLEGTSLAELAARGVPLTAADVVDRLTFLAGALDFAEAAGVLHGALSSHDVIFSAADAGVSGFGLVQALESAGIEGFHAHRDDDVAAFGTIARELLGTRLTPGVAAVLDGPLPGTALAMAGALQAALLQKPSAARSQPDAVSAPPALVAPVPSAPATGPAAQLDLLDIPLRDTQAPDRFVDEAPVVDLRTPDRFLEDTPVADVRTPNRFMDDAPAVNRRPMFGMSPDSDAASPLPTTPDHRGHSRKSTIGWLITGAVALALGVFAGFAGGFFAGHGTPAAGPGVVTPATTPAHEATNGQAYTDAAVDEPKPAEPKTSDPTPAARAVAPRASRPTHAPAPPPGQSASTRAATRVAPPQETPSGPAAVKVESLPAGAQVFVDGRSVGYAPLVVGELTPGTHSIRMQLPGYRPWVSAVTLGPGARERVAASLEQ